MCSQPEMCGVFASSPPNVRLEARVVLRGSASPNVGRFREGLATCLWGAHSHMRRKRLGRPEIAGAIDLHAVTDAVTVREYPRPAPHCHPDVPGSA